MSLQPQRHKTNQSYCGNLTVSILKMTAAQVVETSLHDNDSLSENYTMTRAIITTKGNAGSAKFSLWTRHGSQTFIQPVSTDNHLPWWRNRLTLEHHESVASCGTCLTVVLLGRICVSCTSIHTHYALANRLVMRRHFCLAVKICDYLKIPKGEGASRILGHWACYKVREKYLCCVTLPSVLLYISQKRYCQQLARSGRRHVFPQQEAE